MFVIVQSWENLSLEERTRPVHEKSAIATQNAGVSITVTSVTDMIVFAVGATTIFPGLRSFCLYCGVGIFFLFIFSILFFSSVLVLDERRVDSRHDACICCYRHRDDYEPPKCAKRQLLQEFFGKIYAPVLMKLSVKVFVVVITVIMFIFGTFGTLNIEQHFDFALFVAPDSYVNEFFDLRQKFFPERGSQSAIYLPNVRLFYEQAAIENLYLNARKDAFIAPLRICNDEEMTSADDGDHNLFDNEIDADDINEIYADDINEIDADDINEIDADDINEIDADDINEIDADDINEIDADDINEIDADDINEIDADDINHSTKRFSSSLFVILFFKVNVSGFMYFWDIKIDVIVTMLFILSVGIAVDYAAHIAHTFMTVTGTRNERTCHTMRNIGPAVFNGGFSTFLVVILMSLSNAYVYQVFFKVFLLVVVFSLFHGLVLLPVLLSWFGPSPLPQYLNEEPTTGEVKAKGEECKEEREAGGVDNTAFEVEICTSKEDDHVDVVSNDDVDDITENAEVACKDELYIQCVEDGETKDDDSKQNADDALQIEEIKDRALFHKSEFAVECVDGVAYSNKVDDFEDGENGRSE
ncbi:patched domain-containing protein 3-like [Antedon mediterranea]|uniref:patched domain-containing protein 3-like n=1 Tax=Antedon mediterranea TaxID=105859 RepID=UPI003AF422A4